MTVYEIYESAIRGLDTVDRQRLIELIVRDLPENALDMGETNVDFASKSMADLFEEIGYIQSTGPSDMARHSDDSRLL